MKLELEDLFVQRESIRGDGTWYFVESGTPKGHDLLTAYQGETLFTGSRAKQRAERVLAILLDRPSDVYAVACPTCNAAPSEPCWNLRVSGSPNGYPHKERIPEAGSQ